MVVIVVSHDINSNSSVVALRDSPRSYKMSKIETRRAIAVFNEMVSAYFMSESIDNISVKRSK